ncbi:hypothetical protein BH11MYX2_BH11MYX2_12960 [soil metagenome]
MNLRPFVGGLLGLTLVSALALAENAPAPTPAPAPVPDAGKRMPAPAPTSKPGVPALVGATELLRLSTPTGFIDDAVTADADRIAYVVADAAAKAELHVYTIATKTEQTLDIAALTLQPTALQFVGAKVLVVGKQGDGFVGGLVDLAPKAKKPVVYKVGPAADITAIVRDGRPRLAVHRTSTLPNGGVKHEVDLLAIDTGAKVGAPHAFEVDSANNNAKNMFRVNDWPDGYTLAHGTKQGEWDRRENERAPDFEITYDLVASRFVDKKKIDDLFEQRRRFQGIAESGGKPNFVRFSWDNTNLTVWANTKSRPIELDQSLAQYDPKSLQGLVNKDGSAWVVLKVDPVNAAAVDRKKADPEYLDIFQVAPDGKSAVRKARILATGARHRFGVVGNKFWLLERNTGFERGAKSFALYDLQ